MAAAAPGLDTFTWRTEAEFARLREQHQTEEEKQLQFAIKLQAAIRRRKTQLTKAASKKRP